MTKRITDQELIDELNRLADELGKPPTQKEMNAQGKHAHGTYQRRFGSWNDALKEAGFEPHYRGRRSGRRKLSRDELLDELHRLADELGKTPSANEMDEYGEYSNGVYHHHFGSWNAALEAAGLEIHNELNITREQLLAELQELASLTGERPTQEMMLVIGNYSPTTYYVHFDSWSEALEEAGLKTDT